jgi:hypothetical protein
MSDDPFTEQGNFTWFACCTSRRARGWRAAWVRFSTPWEREDNLRELANPGVVLLGEFPTEKEAFDAACAALALLKEQDAACARHARTTSSPTGATARCRRLTHGYASAATLMQE